MPRTMTFSQRCTAIRRISRSRKLARYLPTFHVVKLPKIKVQLTEHLRSQFDDGGADLLRMFSDWKALGPAGEYHHYYFGKDGEYDRPLVDGKKVLRHVHILPDDNSPYMANWNRDWKYKTRKRSDDVLIYSPYSQRFGYLLIAVILEPNGHDFAEMRTPEDAAAMGGFASVADQFLWDGTIIV